MEKQIINDTLTAIGTGVVTGGVGGAVANLYSFTQTKEFEISMFFISIIIGAFVGYIVGEYTTSGPLCGVAGALSMKIFEFVQDYGNQILKKTVEKKLDMKLETKNK